MTVDFGALNRGIATWYNEGQFTNNDVKTKVKSELAKLFDAMDKNNDKKLEKEADCLKEDYFTKKLGLQLNKSITKDDFCNAANIAKIIQTMGDNTEKLDNSFLDQEKVRKQEQEKARKQEQENKQKAEKANKDAFSAGYSSAIDLIGDTDASEREAVRKRINKITKETVKEFIQGYYSNKYWGDGLFEQIGSEGTKFKCKDIVPLMKAALDAVPADKKDSSEYKKAYSIYSRYAEKDRNADFTGGANGFWSGMWRKTFGDNYLKDFDNAIETLLGIEQ